MTSAVVSHPAPSVVLELLKPITWFPPMWALGCGIVSSGVSPGQRWPMIVAGVLLAGPMVCGTSQAVNDWYDRHVDAINEPDRPIPSGRIPGRWGLYIAILWTALSLLLATVLGTWGFVAAIVGLVLAWAYSAPPIRLKQNGWWGNAACGICYEGLPWFTGAAVMSASAPDWHIVLIALLYSIGAHGIMTLNDFKSVEGDKRMGIDSLPVLLGVDNAARFACVVMAAPQVAVVALLLVWQRPFYAAAVAVLLLSQLLLMSHFLKSPRQRAPWYNGTGISCYVVGMLVSAFALAALKAS
ncbi:chlorophyll synthase ChlG [Bradyrhizobium sp. MOS003]|uniref:chlorophyll synthase ChlG n=1 Tax=Bradyrhizobium sp. MOS003 TaxID=2133946 RepID=UPI000D122423|nr:chlorophyll synthase ChlG [Bradyrhizobium sp. MOS003]PSO21566.1 bacteriochlorophyll/chlorophyll a synthase [Bradyrhizobium sp. MOS003]